MLKVRIWIWTIGLLFTQLFVVCVLRDLVSPLSPGLRRGFEILLPGFKWLTVWRFLLGLAESFLWGVYAALVLVPIMNTFLLKHPHAATVQEHEKRHEYRPAA
ncbi:MAG: hypothetical protein ACM3SW_04510 [Actinomycetota bacterium]